MKTKRVAKAKARFKFSKVLAILLALVLAMPTMAGVLPLVAGADEGSTSEQDNSSDGYDQEKLSLKKALDDGAATQSQDLSGEATMQTEDGGVFSPMAASYTVSFFMPGATEALSSPVLDVAENTPVSSLLPLDPTKEGATFMGWRDRDVAGSEAMTARAMAELMVTKNLNLEAVFAQNYLVTFMVGDASYTTQTVAQGQLATLPTAPDLPDGKVSFTGWFVNSACTIEFSFNTPITAPLTLYAGFSDKYLVMFKNAAGEVYESQLVASGASALRPSYNPPSLVENESFMYWYIEGDESETRFDFLHTPINADTVLVPKFGNTHYVFFNSQGSMVESPVAVVHGETLAALKPNNPTREGYIFAFWSTDSHATYDQKAEKEYDFTQPVNAGFTLTGIWKPANDVKYTIAFWMEKTNYSGTPTLTNPSDYAYVHSIVRSDGTAGEMTAVQGSDSDISTLFTTGTNASLKYADFQDVENKVIKGDGSTVVNVYATRKVYTYIYDLRSALGSDRSMTIGGTKYTEDGPKFTINVTYGEDVTNKLPWAGNINATFANPGFLGTGRAFNGWLTYDTNFWGTHINWNRMSAGEATLISRNNTIHAELLSSDGQTKNYTLYGSWGNDDDTKYLYLAEPLEGQASTTDPDHPSLPLSISYQGSSYTELREYRQTVASEDLSAKAIYGYTSLNDNPQSRWYKDGQWYTSSRSGATRYDCFFYERKGHTFVFDLQASGASVGNQPIPLVREVPFGASLVALEPKSDPIREGYEFGGWYTSSDYFEEFDFTNTMPDGEVKVFARWIPAEVTATYYSVVGGTEVDAQSYARASTLELSAEYAVGVFYEGLGEFIAWGWFLPNSDALEPLGSEFTINNDMDIYGIWKTDNFSLSYDANGGRGVLPEDETLYKLHVLAPVSAEGDLTRNADEVFIGWQVDGEGPVYYPGSQVAMQGDITLVAFYANSSTLVDLTYNANYGGSPATIKQKGVVGESFMPLGNDAFLRAGYMLAGWSSTPEGDIDYEFGKAIEITGAITLYAVWEKEESFTVEFRIKEGQETGGMLDGKTLYENVKGGTSFDELIADEGRSVAIAKPGYRFVGWEPADPPNMYVNGNWIFYAVFVEQLTVTFKGGEGVILSGSTSFTVDKGSSWSDAIDKLPIPILLPSYNLSEWSPDIPDDDFVIRENMDFSITAERMNVIVTVRDAEKVYDGSPLTSDAFTVSGLPDGYVLSAELNGTQTDVGSSENSVKVDEGGGLVYTITDEEGVDVTQYFNGSYLEVGDAVEVDAGSLTVSPRPLTLTANSLTKTAGTTDPTFTAQVTSGSLVEGESIGYSLSRVAGEAVGSYSIDISLLANPNYLVRPVSGVFTITATPVVPVVPVVPVAPVDPVTDDGTDTPAAPETEIADEDTPLAASDDEAVQEDSDAQDIVDDETPLISTNEAYWALWNLILAIITAGVMLLMLAGIFVGSKKKESRRQSKFWQNSLDSTKASSFRPNFILRLLTLLPGVAAVLVFSLTQNMTLPMQMIDNWTILMVILTLVQGALAFFILKKTGDDAQGENRRVAASTK